LVPHWIKSVTAGGTEFIKTKSAESKVYKSTNCKQPTCSNWVTGSLVFLKLSSLLVSRSVQSTIGNYTRNLQPAAARSHRYTCRDDLKIGPCQKRTEKPMQKLLPHRVEKLATGGKPAARKRVPQETLKREATGRPALRAVAHIACQTTGLYYSIRS